MDQYSDFIQLTATNIAGYLRPYIHQMADHYKWKLDLAKANEALGHDFTKFGNDYEQSVKIKEIAMRKVEACQNYDERFKFGKYFVEEWGGIKTNKMLKSKLEEFDQIDLSEIATLQGVSSWSKYLSLRQAKAAIYDSRVAYAINAINHMNKNSKYFFPVPDGRSSLLGLLDIETLFILDHLKENDDFISDQDIAHKQHE